ncbi:MAG: cytochrome c maturation protein CcmE [Acidimicrobiales bacterium]|nr:cytochrome c maturation protein CcmE [Acidimicrobiales bacterium]
MDVTSPELPDDRDLDEGGLDLTPRADRAPTLRSRSARRWGAIAVLVALGAVVVFIMVQAQGASLYYRNADEAVAQRDSLGQDRFRLQGVVVGQPVDDGNAKVFEVAYRGVAVTVRHTGKEPALFKPGLPVVAEGAWNAAGTEFDSDRLLVKHTEDYKKADDGEYEEQHPDRVPETEADAEVDDAASPETPTGPDAS